MKLPLALAAPFLRFDFIGADGRPAPATFTNPVEVIVATRTSDVRDAMRAVEEGLRRGCHAAGFVSYEAAPGFDDALITHESGRMPLVWFGLFEHREVETPWPDESNPTRPAGGRTVASVWRPDVTAQDYRRAVDAVRDAILDGESYQANYTFRLRSWVDCAMTEAIYQYLVQEQRAPYSAFLDIGDWQVISASPELFFRIDSGVVTTRPMKGTAARGSSPADDAAQAEWLRSSEKNRAENVMIVDLARNDVGRIAEVGSVRVSSLFDVERYPSLWQMVSTVEGRVRSNASLTDVFTAMFPAGSITGAPKAASMRLIASLEASPRGVYCGAIGFASPNGPAVFSVGIRTMTIDTTCGRAEYGAGGGITWDSTADDEHDEAMAKAATLSALPAFELLETLRLEPGEMVRLDRHLARLRASALALGFRCDDAALRTALLAHARQWPGARRRVRLRVSRSGAVTIESAPADQPILEPVTVALASEPIARGEPLLVHKTTARGMYERHRRSHPDAFDVLLWNENGELTEFTIGNVVVDLHGERCTPPVSCGLLPGVFRGALIESGAVRERPIRVAELESASRIWLVNSVREWVEVRLRLPGGEL